MNRIHIATFGPITLEKNGIEYLYASLDKHPYVRAVLDKANCVLIKHPDSLLILPYSTA